MGTNTLEEKMLEKAQREVVGSAEWLTAQVILQRYQVDPEIWLIKKHIFAIDYDGKILFPSYALNPQSGYCPQSTLGEIINLFETHGRNAWGIAFWFSSLCGFLGGRRPQDLLITDSVLVLAAAQDEVTGISHG
ncbi:MAG: hypothetical protein AAGC78_06470 [Cellvibrio sp.]|uniref:hypothetical protein n=1 Tax=Cellvibrio sp. TaxID=1965322 RepID=UPI0031AB3918